MRSFVTGVAWPGMPSQRGSVLLSLLFQLERTQWWPAERLLEHQLLQLTKLAQHAYDTVPFYRQRFDAAQFRPGDGLSLAAFRALPVLTRREVQDAGAALGSGRLPPEHGRPAESSTAGSTGEPVKVLGTDVTAVFWEALALRDHLWHRRDLSGKLAVIRTAARGLGEPPQGSMLGDWGPPASEVFATGPCALLRVTTDIDVQARWLMQQEPDYLLSYPSNLAALITHMCAMGERPRSLRAVRTVSEAVAPELRTACREEWGVPLQDVYSSFEFGYIALQCPASEQYHVMSETVLVEVLAADGRPCRPGEIGRMVVTSLHNYAMPLIRYALGDYAEVGATCPCGRRLPLLARIYGRERNMLTMPDGSQRWPSFPARRWSHTAPVVRQLQLEQESAERIVVRIVADRELTAEEETGLIAALRQALGYPGEMKLQREEEIPRGAGGKYEQFVSRVKTRQ